MEWRDRLFKHNGNQMNIYTELQIEGYEKVVRCDNNDIGFTAWVAVHNSVLGPALGGCRVWNYSTDDEALFDVLRLAKGMTYKNALARLPLGGGKAVIRCNIKEVDRDKLFDSFGLFVDTLDGAYITAEDVNSTLRDMEKIQQRTKHVATVGASGNPSPYTAYGVYCAIKAAAEFTLKRNGLNGLIVAVQGVGETGGRLAELLAGDGCRIVAADINNGNLRLLQEKMQFDRAKPEDIHSVPCDIFSPCALGGILNDQTIPQLQCSIVAGSANNQLLHENHGEALRKRGVLYVPDFAANAGGVINISCEIGQSYDPVRAKQNTARIGDCVTDIIRTAQQEKLPTNLVANRIAEQIIVSARGEQEKLLKTG